MLLIPKNPIQKADNNKVLIVIVFFSNIYLQYIKIKPRPQDFLLNVIIQP